MHLSLRWAAALLLAAGPAPLQAQTPDSTRVVEVESLTVTRAPEPLSRAPRAVDVLNGPASRRGQATLGIDEALSNLPGVYVANRYNFSVDQRLSLRGAGSRSSFGARGVKILLDGVPQTLPDGQSQLTNLELSSIGRIEVLRGASSALYGNAAGGVISFISLPTAPDPLAASARATFGSFGLAKEQLRLSGRRGVLAGAVDYARTTWDGFRQQSRFEGNAFNAAVDWLASGSTAASFRYRFGDTPLAENPGALDAAELAADRDSAPANNILRDASKDVDQHQLSATLKHYAESGAVYEVTAFGFARHLDNPLATNNWNRIERRAGGVRLQGTRPLGASGAARLTAGLDLQAMHDDRANYTPVPAVGPVTDTTVRQEEEVLEVGPFVELSWPVADRYFFSAGARYDAVRFEVTDLLLDDGDNSGARTMSSLSGGVGMSAALTPGFTPYLNLSTGFETPTTTELAVNQAGVGGFNDSLGPQRSLSVELGGRGAVGTSFTWTAAYFLVQTEDALVPFAEAGGRSFFRNAGATRNRGTEFGFGWMVRPGVRLQGAWTHADYRFRDYIAITNAGADTADFSGRRLPGVPTEFLRLGLRATLPHGLWLDVDHTLSGEMYADDANTQQVDGWGAGVSNVRFGWDGRAGALRLAPFAAINNAWDREYVGSVTVNGFGGRVYEPSPGRNYYVGVEVGWRRVGG